VGRPDGQEIVGRSAELATAGRLLRRALDGEPVVLVVGGEAGIGKSRLVGAVAADARTLGFRLGAGACLRMDAGEMPYAAIVAALRRLLRDVDPAVAAATLGAHRREIARLLPEAARIASPVAGPRTASPAGAAPGPSPVPHPASPAPAGAAGIAGGPDPLARLRLFEAVSGWLDRLAADAPLLLIIEDLQWADAATLDLLRAVALALPGRALLAITLRTDEPAPAAVGATIAELARDGADRVELRPLDRGTFGRLAAGALGDATEPDPAAVDDLYERTGGNPFLALELIEAGLLAGPDNPYAGVPPSLRDILDARMVALDTDTLAILRAAALQPGPIDDALLAGVLDRPVGVVANALRVAREAGVLATSSGGPVFRHALQRDVLIEQLGPGERRQLHARFAEVLAAGGQDPSRAGAIALHCDLAGDDARSLRANVAAFESAERASAFEAAMRHAARAAELRRRLPAATGDELPDAAALLEAASLAALLAGDPVRSAALAREALALVGPDAGRAASLHDRVRWALWEAGDREGARRELEIAVAGLAAAPADAGTEVLRARLTAQQAAMRMDEADAGPALGLAAEAIRAARDLGAPDVEAIALGVRGRTLAMHGRVDEGLADLRAAVAIADQLHNLQGRLVGEASVVTVLSRCGRAREALAEIDAALAVADASGLGRSLGAQLAAEAARSCFAIGEWDEAARRIADGLARRPTALVEAHLRIVGLRLAAARGDDADATRHDRRLIALEPVLADAEDRAALAAARAELVLGADRAAAVRGLIDPLLAQGAAGAPGSAIAWLGALAVRAEVELALDARARGDGPAAAAALGRSATIATMTEAGAVAARAAWGPRADALLAHVGAERARLDAPTAARVVAWDRAIEAWEAIDRPYSAAYARLRLAEARLANREPREAVAAPLVAAASALRALGAQPMLEWARRLARLARVDLGEEGSEAGSGARASAGADARDPLATLELTPREREVLRLVAAGRSNARIADELGITTKTASVHVSNILGKLGVENRVEAAALAHRLGVAGRDDR
jgi:DNA-binding CsgD family transcriptional regulator